MQSAKSVQSDGMRRSSPQIVWSLARSPLMQVDAMGCRSLIFGRLGGTLTCTQSPISRAFMIFSRTLLVAVAVSAMYGVPGGTSALISASRLNDGQKSLLLQTTCTH